MESSFLSLIIALLVGVSLGAVALYLYSRKNGSQESQNTLLALDKLREDLRVLQNEHRQEMQSQLGKVNDQLYRGLSDSQRAMQQQFEQTTKIIGDVTTRLTSLDATSKQVLDFSGQLQNLQSILKNPKQRGVLGEYWLETLLSNVLPKESYRMQHSLGADENTQKELIADAVVFIRDQMIPIDAKFSLENYNRLMETTDADARDKLEKLLKADLKERIDETAKYIQPQKGTMNFSFMFIPAEGVYYNLMNAEVGSGINSRSLIDYAFGKHVMIVSPTCFFAYLQTVLLGLRELQLEKSTQDILKRVSDLGRHFNAYADYHNKVGNNLVTVVNQYNLASKEMVKVSKDVVRITSGSADEILETVAIDKPLLEEILDR